MNRCSEASRQEVVSMPDASAKISSVWDALCQGMPPPGLQPDLEPRGATLPNVVMCLNTSHIVMQLGHSSLLPSCCKLLAEQWKQAQCVYVCQRFLLYLKHLVKSKATSVSTLFQCN